MANLKRNKAVSRYIVALGTALAGIAIWWSVVNYPPSAASSAPQNTIAANAPALNSNFSVNDLFLLQPDIQTGPIAEQPVAPVLPTPVQPVPMQPPPAQPAASQTAAVQPTPTQPTITQPPAPQPAPAPRLRTRGS